MGTSLLALAKSIYYLQWLRYNYPAQGEKRGETVEFAGKGKTKTQIEMYTCHDYLKSYYSIG